MIDWKTRSTWKNLFRRFIHFLSRGDVQRDSLQLLLDSARPNAVAFVKVEKYNQGEIAQLFLSIVDVHVIDLIRCTKRIDHLKQRPRTDECRIGMRRGHFSRFHRVDNGETTVFQIAASNGVKLLADDDRVEIVVVTAQSITQLSEEKLAIGFTVLDVDAIASRDIRVRFDETLFSFDVFGDRIEENHTESNNPFDQQRRERERRWSLLELTGSIFRRRGFHLVYRGGIANDLEFFVFEGKLPRDDVFHRGE